MVSAAILQGNYAATNQWLHVGSNERSVPWGQAASVAKPSYLKPMRIDEPEVLEQKG